MSIDTTVPSTRTDPTIPTTALPDTTYRTDTERVSLTVNGEPVTVSARHPHLLHALREELGITSPKDGCSPQGQCGCCTVMIDGKASITCQMPLTRAAGKSVTTLEGFEPAEVERYSETFAACGALQCGFCTPGLVVRAKAQIDKKGTALTREERARHLGGHLCRCTGYVKILDAIEALAQGTVVTPGVNGGVGTSGVKYEGRDLAVGRRPYIDDMPCPACCTARSCSRSTREPTSSPSTRLPHSHSPASLGSSRT